MFVLGAAGNVIVFGVVKRNGHVKAMPIAAHNQLEVMREIQAHTREGSLYYTDEWQAYATLRTRGEHVMIRKEKGRPLARPHQRYRGLLELRQELAVSVPRRTHQILSSLPGRSLLAFQPS